jgi:hypothetical protein
MVVSCLRQRWMTMAGGSGGGVEDGSRLLAIVDVAADIE